MNIIKYVATFAIAFLIGQYNIMSAYDVNDIEASSITLAQMGYLYGCRDQHVNKHCEIEANLFKVQLKTYIKSIRIRG